MGGETLTAHALNIYVNSNNSNVHGFNHWDMGKLSNESLSRPCLCEHFSSETTFNSALPDFL